MPPATAAHKRRKRTAELQDFYDKANQSEVILIEDTPPGDGHSNSNGDRDAYRSGHPSVNDEYEGDNHYRHKAPGGDPPGYVYANGSTAVATRGSKRSRKAAPAVHNANKPPSPIPSAPVTKRRRKEPAQPDQHLHPQYPAHAPEPPSPLPLQNGYAKAHRDVNQLIRDETDHFKKYPGTQYPKPVSARDSYTSTSSKTALQPPYDDKEGHYIIRPDENLTSRCRYDPFALFC